MNRLQDYLQHIVEAINRIEDYTAAMNQDVFLISKMTQDAVIRNIEIIGDAGHSITKTYPEFAVKNPHLSLMQRIKCEMRSRMDISQLILVLFGQQLLSICLSCVPM